MQPFYVTYALGSNLDHCYSTVYSDDYAKAREMVERATNLNFAFMYNAESFKGQPEKYGLTEVDLQPQVMVE